MVLCLFPNESSTTIFATDSDRAICPRQRQRAVRLITNRQHLRNRESPPDLFAEGVFSRLQFVPVPELASVGFRHKTHGRVFLEPECSLLLNLGMPNFATDCLVH